MGSLLMTTTVANISWFSMSPASEHRAYPKMKPTCAFKNDRELLASSDGYPATALKAKAMLGSPVAIKVMAANSILYLLDHNIGSPMRNSAKDYIQLTRG